MFFNRYALRVLKPSPGLLIFLILYVLVRRFLGKLLLDLSPTHSRTPHFKDACHWNTTLLAERISQIDLTETKVLAEPSHNLFIGYSVLLGQSLTSRLRICAGAIRYGGRYLQGRCKGGCECLGRGDRYGRCDSYRR